MSWFLPKRKSIIFLLLISSLIVFAYARKEIFFHQTKKLIKQNLEKNFPFQFSIGDIRAGLVYGLVLENLSLSFPQDNSGPAFHIKLNKAYVNYNLWQDLFDLPKDSEKELSLGNFVFVLEGGQLSFGNSRPLLKNLQGRIRVSQKDLYFQDIQAAFQGNTPDTLKIYGELTEEHFSLTANIAHLKAGNFDVLTNLSLILNKKYDLQNQVQKQSGTLKTYGSVLNNRPFPELSSSFEIQGKKLRILTFSLGDNYDLRGVASLSAPFNADLSLNFNQAVPGEIISQFAEPNFSGLVNGLIKVTGELNRPKVDGYLEAKEGRIGDLAFVSADINIKGRYPRIFIVDSRIYREEDSFLMEGEIDFTNLQLQDFFDIRVKADKGMLWQGWDITRRHKNQVHMSKSVADDVKVTFDSFMEDTRKGYPENYANELGLEYKVFGDKLFKVRLKKEEGILGVERRIKF